MKSKVSVESPGLYLNRNGRGFSREELLEAKLTIKEARESGLIVDERRKTKYQKNVDALNKYKEEYAKVLAEKEKLRLKNQKENKKARKEAEEQKIIDEKEKNKKLKEIEEEKRRVQEEIARREAEALAAAEAEELTEDELSELAELEEESTTPLESPEETLKKLEGDLAESLIVTTPETEEEEALPDGTKRVVKRVRKKPTSSTKGASTQAQKKD